MTKMSELFHVAFSTDDLDWMAEEAEVSIEEATSRAEAASSVISDTLTRLGNDLLLEAVQGTL